MEFQIETGSIATAGIFTKVFSRAADFSTMAPRSSVKVVLESSLSATDRVYLSPYRYVRVGEASIGISSPSLEVELLPLP